MSLGGQKKRAAYDVIEEAQPPLPKKLAPPYGIFDEVIDTSRIFLLSVRIVFESLQPAVSGDEILLPLPPLYWGQPERFRDSIIGESLLCIRRAAFYTLYDDLRAHSFSYLNGPSGVGKSFALYFLYCQLSATPNTRVIYIDTCRWLLSLGFRYLLQAAASAFANDDDCLRIIDSFATGDDWAGFLKRISTYCVNNNLTLWVILDQHNSIPTEQRKGMLALEDLSMIITAQHRDRNCHVVVSASANNEDRVLRAASTVTFNSGFTDDEFKTWCRTHNFGTAANFPQPPTSQDEMLDNLVTLVKPITGLIPLELDILEDTCKKVPDSGSSDMKDLLLFYVRSRIRSVETDLRHFRSTRVKTLDDQQQFSNACNALLTGNPSTGPIFMDKRIMFVVTSITTFEVYVRPVFPFVRQAVLAVVSTSDLLSWVGPALKEQSLTIDAKGRSVEVHYKG